MHFHLALNLSDSLTPLEQTRGFCVTEGCGLASALLNLADHLTQV